MYNLKFSILIPTYNGEKIIGETLRSILSQSFSNYEIIIQDDSSKDNTIKVIKSFKDSRIKLFKNKKNLGYTKNIEEARKKATGEIIYLMGQDDILGTDALAATYNAFMTSEDIGAVTRPYYWFDKDINIPVRAKEQLNPFKDEIVGITDNYSRIITVYKTLDQLSGLAYRVKYMDLPFHQDVFPCHVYPFASIFKKHPIVFLKDYIVAVRIRTSQSRKASLIYGKSPIQSWVEMFNNVFYEEEFEKLKQYCIENFVAINYVGLVQIRNYAKYGYLLREIYLLIKYRWQNIFDLGFWFYSLICLLTPRFLLIKIVDEYKNKVLSRIIKSKIKINHEL